MPASWAIGFLAHDMCNLTSYDRSPSEGSGLNEKSGAGGEGATIPRLDLKDFLLRLRNAHLRRRVPKWLAFCRTRLIHKL